MRPLLLANTDVYSGPWIPTSNLTGVMVAEGLMEGEDEVIVSARDVEEVTEDTVLTLCQDIEVSIGRIKKALVRARRTKSSGREVFVWIY